MIFLRMFSRRWILTTLLVILAMGVLARLGKWQLDRLAQRRAFNARVEAQVNAPPLKLDQTTLSDDLVNMEYRQVQVQGTYDFAGQVAIRNQALNGEWGVDLITPLKISGTENTGRSVAILVNRGWIPAPDFTSGDWSKYDQPGVQQVTGVIRRSQTRPDFGTRRDPTPVPGQVLKDWNFVNIPAISQQLPYQLLPVYIQRAPEPSQVNAPVGSKPALDLTEGPHLGYAIQWFAFAILLGGGYPFFIRRQESQKEEGRDELAKRDPGAVTR